jgi:dTDP-4-dehydrorhamnose reductase
VILIVGASGLLGSNLSLLCSLHSLPFHGTYLRHTMTDPRGIFSRRDLRMKSEVESLFSEVEPDIVINTSAYTNIDGAEESSYDAYSVNADLPALLAEESKHRNAHFIHISTDGIFDGKGIPLTEQDSPKPVNVYASSKRGGERKVLAANSSTLIIRTCIYGWSCMGRESLAEWMLKQFEGNRTFVGFTDVFFNPLYVGTLSRFILELTELRASGLINVGSRNCMSKFEFARALADEFGLDAGLVKPGSLADFQFGARRPNYTVLDCGHAERLLAHAMPTMSEDIRAFREFRDDGMRRQLKQWGLANGHDKDR